MSGMHNSMRSARAPLTPALSPLRGEGEHFALIAPAISALRGEGERFALIAAAVAPLRGEGEDFAVPSVQGGGRTVAVLSVAGGGRRLRDGALFRRGERDEFDIALWQRWGEGKNFLDL